MTCCETGTTQNRTTSDWTTSPASSSKSMLKQLTWPFLGKNKAKVSLKSWKWAVHYRCLDCTRLGFRPWIWVDARQHLDPTCYVDARCLRTLDPLVLGVGCWKHIRSHTQRWYLQISRAGMLECSRSCPLVLSCIIIFGRILPECLFHECIRWKQRGSNDPLPRNHHATYTSQIFKNCSTVWRNKG